MNTFRFWQEAVFEWRLVRFVAAVLCLLRGTLYLRAGRLYRAVQDLCWIVRVTDAPLASRVARRAVFRTIETARRGPDNPLVESYRADPESTACASLYAIAGSGSHDLFRDLIVLKGASASERGVVLLKYGRTFDAVVALFDVRRLMERYTFVLEPCWAGYCDPSILQWIAPGHPVVVQCFTPDDYRFIEAVGAPLVPIRLGPADWVDADLFTPGPAGAKRYDIVMVANWGAHKRHAQLFRALARIPDRHIRVLLVGFPWANRTAQDIRAEARMAGDRVTVDIVESIPAAEVAGYVGQSKIFVFLSRKEGDNKALVEAMFAGVPAVVYERTVGGAASRINRATGVLSSDEGLPERIAYMLDHHEQFTPRAWALEHTGSAAATRVLNEAIRQAVVASGGLFTEDIVEKTNSPNLAYKDPACRARFRADYEYILSCRRDAVLSVRKAVA